MCAFNNNYLIVKETSPKDLEAAAWILRRDLLGLIRHWPNTGTYLLISVAGSLLLQELARLITRHVILPKP